MHSALLQKSNKQVCFQRAFLANSIVTLGSVVERKTNGMQTVEFFFVYNYKKFFENVSPNVEKVERWLGFIRRYRTDSHRRGFADQQR